MKEKNQDTLRDALNRLSSYQPKEDLWENLQEDLSKEEVPTEVNRDQLQSAIGLMTSYRAPKSVWNKIEQRLNKPRIPLFRPYSIAAAIGGLLLMGATMWYIMGDRVEEQVLPPVLERKIDAPLELEEAEKAIYEEEVAKELLKIQACLDQIVDQEKEAFTREIEEIEKLTDMDSTEWERIRRLKKSVCE